MAERSRILVVEDEPEMLELISDFLTDREGYRVWRAACGREALEDVLSRQAIDLVLSDINMPEMKGFELLKTVEERYPSCKRVLMTGYNVESYLELAMTYGIGNIFAKSIPFNFNELAVVVRSLLRDEIFGVLRHLSPDANHAEFTVTRGATLDRDAERAMAMLPEAYRSGKVELAVFEMLTNAIFYGIRGEKPESKEGWDYDFELEEGAGITVTVAWDDEKYAIAIGDNGGRLKKRDVLYWLYRQSTSNEEGAPIGVFDTHGRGFFIARKYLDRVIINVAPGKRTEVILMNYVSPSHRGFKPLSINEL